LGGVPGGIGMGGGAVQGRGGLSDCLLSNGGTGKKDDGKTWNTGWGKKKRTR